MKYLLIAGACALAANSANATNNSNDTPTGEEQTETLFSNLTTLYDDGEVSATWGGRIFNDIGFADADDNYPTMGEDGFEFRQARLWAKFKIGKHISGKAEFDFAGTGTSFKDVYLQLATQAGNIKTGNFKQPLGLERLGSSGATTFMEVAMATEAFTPSRDNGIQISDSIGKKTSWALGFFRRSDDDSAKGTGGGEFTTTGRLTHTLGEDRHIGHVGVSVSQWAGQDVRFRARPEYHLTGRALDSMTMATDGLAIYALEGAWVRGPLSVQGEYFLTSIDDVGGPVKGHTQLTGYYAFVSWFLNSSDHRNYKSSNGTFGAAKPAEKWNGGLRGGAKEIALRYSSTDFDEAGGLEASNITLGFNWYLNANARIMLNLVQSNVESTGVGIIDDDMTAIMMRFQAHW